jgi:hypothetical protein
MWISVSTQNSDTTDLVLWILPHIWGYLKATDRLIKGMNMIGKLNGVLTHLKNKFSIMPTIENIEYININK